MPSDRIVAVGFLTQNDLKVLGESFDRMFPVNDDAGFDDLVAKLDGIAAGVGLAVVAAVKWFGNRKR